MITKITKTINCFEKVANRIAKRKRKTKIKKEKAPSPITTSIALKISFEKFEADVTIVDEK